jgi:hypothetical protein
VAGSPARGLRPTIKVEGARELAQALYNARDKELKKELRKVYRQSAQTVVRDARPRVPKRSGRLAKTLKAASSITRGWVTAGSNEVPYAGPIHFGWPSRPNSARDWRGGPIAPNPFLWDALDARRGEVQDAFEKGVQAVVDKVNRT